MSAPLRVVVCGPECTGKTTLARDLAARYGTTWAPEYLREFVDRKLARGLRPGAALVEPGEVRAIVLGQVEAEERAAAHAVRLLFCDTNPLQSLVYCQHYFGTPPAWLERLLAGRRYDLYLLLDVDVAWLPDPQRDRPGQRAELLELFRQALEARGLPRVEIRGSWPERFERACSAVDRLLEAG